MDKHDLALNNPQGLICHKTQLTKLNQRILARFFLNGKNK